MRRLNDFSLRQARTFLYLNIVSPAFRSRGKALADPIPGIPALSCACSLRRFPEGPSQPNISGNKLLWVRV
jgi:hypothetical protein